MVHAPDRLVAGYGGAVASGERKPVNWYGGGRLTVCDSASELGAKSASPE
jgi:hypothetical protein